MLKGNSTSFESEHDSTELHNWFSLNILTLKIFALFCYIRDLLFVHRWCLSTDFIDFTLF